MRTFEVESSECLVRPWWQDRGIPPSGHELKWGCW